MTVEEFEELPSISKLKMVHVALTKLFIERGATLDIDEKDSIGFSIGAVQCVIEDMEKVK